MDFETSEEHYAYLLEQANGGTQHTMATVPQWGGLWQPAGTTRNQIFLEQSEIREGVLTAAYEQQFRETRQIVEERGTTYDRITQCEAPGYPRYLGQAYTHEFINLPHQSYQINDVGNGIRRGLHRGRAQQRLRDPLLVRRHHWVLGRRPAYHKHRRSTARRVHAQHAADKQPVRVRGNLGSEDRAGRHRETGGSGDVLRLVCAGQTGSCRLRLPTRNSY